jgi:snurportin-1
MLIFPVTALISFVGRTVSRSRTGVFIEKFNSMLPGGSLASTTSRMDNCVLDCLFDESTQTYYILDMLYCRNQSFYDCDTELRSVFEQFCLRYSMLI